MDRWRDVRPIQTRYAGHHFRSRLEARWAVFMEHAGVRWEYEPEGFELGGRVRYLPDFWLPGLDCFVEVKPEDVSKEQWLEIIPKVGGLAEQSGKRVVVFLGNTSLAHNHATPFASFFPGETPCRLYYQWAACLECGEIDIAPDPIETGGPMRCGHHAIGSTPQLLAAFDAATAARF